MVKYSKMTGVIGTQPEPPILKFDYLKSMSFSERGPLGNSDYPITKPQNEWKPEAKSNTLSPEDQAALREFLRQYVQAKKKDDQYQMGMTANEIAELIGQKMDEQDLDVLSEELGMDPNEERSLPEHHKITKETAEEEQIAETAGREKIRRGDYFPQKTSGKRTHRFETSKSKTTNLDQKRDSKVSKGNKPMWKARRSQKRKSKLVA